MEVGFLIALFGGIISFISPCVLPIIPMYIAYISGISIKEIENGGKKPVFRVFINSLFFVLGFTVVFTILAALFYLFATSLGQFKVWFERIAGVILIVFGLHIMGVLKIPFLNYEAKMKNEKRNPSIWSSLAMGFVFGAGWTPCIGPILSGILFSSTAADNIGKAIGLLVVYSLGIGIPFILTGLATRGLMSLFKSIKKHYKVIEIISGAFLIILGILLMFGLMNVISGLGGESSLETRLTDKDPPRVSIKSPSEGDVEENSFPLVLRLRDESGVKAIYLSVDGGEFTEIIPDSPEQVWWTNQVTIQSELAVYAADVKDQIGKTNYLILDTDNIVIINPE